MSQDASKRDFQPPQSSATTSPAMKRELAPSLEGFASELGPLEKSSAEAARQWQGSPFRRPSPMHHHHHAGAAYAAHPHYMGQPTDKNNKNAMIMMNDPLYMATELAKEQHHDDLGPAMADCLNIGSFDADSPLRGKRPSRNKQPKASSPPPPQAYGSSAYPPPYYHGYMYYPPSNTSEQPQQPRQQQQQQQPTYAYAYAPPPYPPSSYPQYSLPPPDQWKDPGFPEVDTTFAQPNEQQQQQSKQASKPMATTTTTTTPHKAPPAAPVRSPFRSPIPDKNSAKKYKRSPLFGTGTPSIGYYGSFGMDTPGGTMDAAKLDEFSPMGPSFPSGFGGDEAAPFPISNLNDSGIQFEPKQGLQQRRASPSSPFSSFLGDMSPLQGAPSPMESRRDAAAASFGPTVPLMASPRSGKSEQASSFPSTSKRGGSTATKGLKPSPVAIKSNSSKQKQSWYDSMGQSSGAASSAPSVRLELGDVGMKQVETRKSLEGINSMVRGTSSHGYERPSSSYDLATPVKRDVSSTFPSAGKHTPMSSRSLKTPDTDKENATPTSKKKKSACNCKKSKCLKLYCECFANEKYCNQCNCADCHNSLEHEAIRAKAIKDTKAKNPNAFKPRIVSRNTPGSGRSAASPSSGHNMGCRCKRSECLKKYCECFQAGVMCGSKCKCVECLNYVGSQALIDKRRKIKDHKGAEFAMRSADEAWKGKRSLTEMRATTMPSPAMVANLQSQQGDAGHMQQRMPPMIQPSPAPHSAQRGQSASSQHYGLAPYPMAPPMGYSPMGLPPAVTPSYVSNKPQSARSDPRRAGGLSAARGNFNPHQQSIHLHRQPQQITPRLATPRTPAVRLGFDPHSSKKKRKLRHGDSKEEARFQFFGPRNPAQTKTVALGVFSYLSNDDLYNAGIVSKSWSRLALDEELWQF